MKEGGYDNSVMPPSLWLLIIIDEEFKRFSTF